MRRSATDPSREIRNVKPRPPSNARAARRKVEVVPQRLEDTRIRCPECGRPLDPWPLKRGARCSSPEWHYCIRNDEASVAEAMRAAFREWDTGSET